MATKLEFKDIRMGTPRYPQISIYILRQDTPYDIVGRVRHTLRLSGIKKSERDLYFDQAKALMPDINKIVELTSAWITTLLQNQQHIYNWKN